MCTRIFWLVMVLVAASPAWSDDFKEESAFFRVDIGGHVSRLEGLTVKRADAAGRLPVALMTHGKPSGLQGMLDTRVDDLKNQARDLASRGWLAVVVIRRGFGRSDGPMPAPASCRSTSLVQRFSADADDLAATMNVVAQRPDADPARMIAIGASAGGPAVIALSARNPKNLLGVINVSGGLRFPDCPKENLLVDAMKEFGSRSRVPGLWLYAKNDGHFGPDLVERMRSAFLDGGGDAKLVMFDPLGQDGHTLFSASGGRYKWLPEMDGFLRFHDLPTWRREDVNALISHLGSPERHRGFLEGYVAAPLEKVLARASGGPELYGTWGAGTITLARNNALSRCQKEKPQERCEIVLENDHWARPTQ
jgi:dienelactone hydrolase